MESSGSQTENADSIRGEEAIHGEGTGRATEDTASAAYATAIVETKPGEQRADQAESLREGKVLVLQATDHVDVIPADAQAMVARAEPQQTTLPTADHPESPVEKDAPKGALLAEEEIKEEGLLNCAKEADEAKLTGSVVESSAKRSLADNMVLAGRLEIPAEENETVREPVNIDTVTNQTASSILDEPQGAISATPARENASFLNGPPTDDLELAREEAMNHLDTQQSDDAGKTGSELQRLRDLVLKSRGSKSQLPPGWDDGEVEDEGIPQRDVNAERLLDRAIASVGAEVISSITDESDDGDSSDSSDAESSSSGSDSSSEESDSSSAVSSANKKGHRQRRGRRPGRGPNEDADDDDDDMDGEPSSKFGPITKNEVIAPTVDMPPFQRVPEDQELRPLGKIHSIVDCIVVVSQDTGRAPGNATSAAPRLPAPQDRTGRTGEQDGEYSVLDTGSLLAFEDRNVLGVVFETFGSVLTPLYALRFNSSSDINQQQISLGKPVWYVPGHSTYVLTRALRAMGKGSDASNIWDEEVAADEQEFSDDEQEAQYKHSLKMAKGKGKKRPHADATGGQSNVPSASRGGKAAVRHALPARPSTSLPLVVTHPDADAASVSGEARAMPLPYDDDDTNSSSPYGNAGSTLGTALAPQAPTPVLHAAGQNGNGAGNAYAQIHGQPSQSFRGGNFMPRGRGRGRGRGVGASSSYGSAHSYSASHLNNATGGVYNVAFQQSHSPYHAGNVNHGPMFAGQMPTQSQGMAYAGGYGAATQPTLQSSGPAVAWPNTSAGGTNSGQGFNPHFAAQQRQIAQPPSNSVINYDPAQPQLHYPWQHQQQHQQHMPR